MYPKKYYLTNKCIDCGKLIHRQAIRCRDCQDRHRALLIKGDKNPNFRHGETLKKHYCSDCGKEISDYRRKRCQSCANKLINLGRKHTIKAKQNMSKALKGKPKSKKHIKNLSLAHGGTGIPYENTEYGAEFDNELKEQVRFRDKYKCQICGCSQLENGKQLDCHHIDYNKKHNILNNLVALCIGCHRKTNFNRKYWKNLFLSRVEV